VIFQDKGIASLSVVGAVVPLIGEDEGILDELVGELVERVGELIDRVGGAVGAPVGCEVGVLSGPTH